MDISPLFDLQKSEGESKFAEWLILASLFEDRPMKGITVLLDRLLLKHQGDVGTTAALTAIRDFHLPKLKGGVKKLFERAVQLDTEQRADILRRALAAWFKTGGTERPNETSRVKVHQGRVYAVLHGTSGVLAVYRVRPDNMGLRAMRRWPSSIEG